MGVYKSTSINNVIQHFTRIEITSEYLCSALDLDNSNIEASIKFDTSPNPSTNVLNYETAPNDFIIYDLLGNEMLRDQNVFPINLNQERDRTIS